MMLLLANSISSVKALPSHPIVLWQGPLQSERLIIPLIPFAADPPGEQAEEKIKSDADMM